MVQYNASQESFPITAKVSGVAVVTIPLAEYSELLWYRSQLKKVKGGKLIQRRETHSRIDLDPEVADFIRERVKAKAYNQTIADECRARFGKDRAPSKSAIHRFRVRERDRLDLGQFEAFG